MVSANQSYFLNDESDDDGSNSGSDGTYTFYFLFGESIGRVCGVGYGVFVSTGIDSIGDIFPLVVPIPIGFNSIVDQLIESLWRPKS